MSLQFLLLVAQAGKGCFPDILWGSFTTTEYQQQLWGK